MNFARMRNERGALVVVVALLISVIGVLLALVVDVGYLYEGRRQLQASADAAAMAAMQEKIIGADDSQVLAVARDYAEKNDFPKDRGTTKALQMVGSAPQTEVGDDYVQVTVSKNMTLFFAPLLEIVPGAGEGISEHTVTAQSRARRVYLTGGAAMMPWGVHTINATRAVATVNGASAELSYNSASGAWEGPIPVPSTKSSTGYPVDLTLYNGQDYPESFPAVASVVVTPTGSSVTDVYFSDNTVAPGGQTYLYVRSTSSPRARIDNKNYNSFTQVSSGLYRTTVTAPSPSNAIQTYPVEITAGSTTISRAAYLDVRIPTHPIEELQLGQAHFSTGGGTTTIQVKVNTFEYGETYNLKVTSNPEAGNFQALDFRYITHPDGTEEGLNSSASDYYDNLSTPYEGVIHVGDVITTKTGNLSGPQTDSRLDTRFAGCTMTFAQWEAAGQPGGCGRLVVVPIVERIERVTGQSDVIVVTPAVFYVEDYAASGGERTNITGRFVRYMKPGEYSAEPPDSGVYAETARLDRPGY